jgi:hypothetical protein
MEAFRTLISQPMSSHHKNQPFIKDPKGSRRLLKDTKFDFVVDRGNKIVANICRLLSGYPGFEGVEYDDPTSVSLEMISEIAEQVVNGNLLLQLMMCREPNRQTSDEIIQYEIRKKYLGDQGWQVNNLTPGYKTLGNGDWIFDDAANVAKNEEVKARSIDFEMSKGNITINDFSKFALVAGGGQGHQMKESKLSTSAETTNILAMGTIARYWPKHGGTPLFLPSRPSMISVGLFFILCKLKT